MVCVGGGLDRNQEGRIGGPGSNDDDRASPQPLLIGGGEEEEINSGK